MREAPRVFTIPVHRNFADAFANGLIAMFGRDQMALARGMVLVPNNRAARAISDAFVRRAEPAILMPRLVAVGDVGDEAIGLALDPAGGDPVPPAIDAMTRQFALARLIQQERALRRDPVIAGEAMRLAEQLAGAIDTMMAEDIDPRRLRELDLGDLARHWEKSLDLLGVVLDRWPEVLVDMGRIDLVARRNILLRRQAAAWRAQSPAGFVAAAGITTSAKAVAELLAVVARLPNGMVVLPGVDIYSPAEEWDTIGEVRSESHPQHHLRILLDRIDVARDDVRRWRSGDGRVRKAQRARVVSNAFAPAAFTSKWARLPPRFLTLPGVRLATFGTVADEAQGIAIALRGAIEVSGVTAALVTPDRALAERVAAHLRRWGIDADDSAGRPLSSTPIGTLLLGLVGLVTESFAPVALLSVLKHPLVMAGEGRLERLAGVRRLDLALRGLRPAPGLSGLSDCLASGDNRERPRRAAAQDWWAGVRPLLEPLEATFGDPMRRPRDWIEALRGAIERLAGEAAWAGAAGRQASALIASLMPAIAAGPETVAVTDLGPTLRQLCDAVAVRPPQGGHPRVSIWGLLEARLQSADLLVLGGLNEGVWPARTVPDPWLAPQLRKTLGLGGLDRRVGLAAHDLAMALGGRTVVMTRALRDTRSPTIASRFLLRLEAMLGGIPRDEALVAMTREVDAHDGPVERAVRPAPAPPEALRPKLVSVTDVDRLKADPYAFYASKILRLRPLDPIDAEPGPAWRGSAVHAIFDTWFREDKLEPDALLPRMDALFNAPGLHPLLRALWWPRLHEAVLWLAERVTAQHLEGRQVLQSEAAGHIDIAGVRLHGRADRIDAIDGNLAIVDYKTGQAPKAKTVRAGFAMQLGLLGLIAERGGFAGITGTPSVFEYWTLGKSKEGFGGIRAALGAKAKPGEHDTLTSAAARDFMHAADRWLTGNDAFLAKLHPEYAPYHDYDQLMRLGEWYGRG